MNEKFFDLKKEKQDRIINAALRAFALGGYMHASTDDIVKMAGISKGLIFHYFETKLGLYQFVYDYSIRVINLEISTGISRDITDFFTIREEVERVYSLCMQQYPYIKLFLYNAAVEDTPEAASAILDTREHYDESIRAILDRGDITRFKPEANYQIVDNMIEMVNKEILERMFQEGVFQPEDYYEEVLKYMEMLRAISYDML
ncbi:TetR/AcrR family transcriptional regulator [Butyrivibrio sp. AC2005]|uniref:TetR/AcrR family transcriptional regulator n=1 Tax=Butyrivibrio sp. AC2005 TaxID=1280672 RepID=UPI0003FDD01A|nr:TetR/AcrR family transcriptional regulator [Butyrivibrio sp. AC2005]